jgi:hypothetical protein
MGNTVVTEALIPTPNIPRKPKKEEDSNLQSFWVFTSHAIDEPRF